MSIEFGNLKKVIDSDFDDFESLMKRIRRVEVEFLQSTNMISNKFKNIKTENLTEKYHLLVEERKSYHIFEKYKEFNDFQKYFEEIKREIKKNEPKNHFFDQLKSEKIEKIFNSFKSNFKNSKNKINNFKRKMKGYESFYKDTIERFKTLQISNEFSLKRVEILIQKMKEEIAKKKGHQIKKLSIDHNELESLEKDIQISFDVFKDYFNYFKVLKKTIDQEITSFKGIIEEIKEIPFILKFYFLIPEVIVASNTEKERREIFQRSLDTIQKKYGIEEHQKKEVYQVLVNPIIDIRKKDDILMYYFENENIETDEYSSYSEYDIDSPSNLNSRSITKQLTNSLDQEKEMNSISIQTNNDYKAEKQRLLDSLNNQISTNIHLKTKIELKNTKIKEYKREIEQLHNNKVNSIFRFSNLSVGDRIICQLKKKKWKVVSLSSFSYRLEKEFYSHISQIKKDATVLFATVKSIKKRQDTIEEIGKKTKKYVIKVERIEFPP